ncbi:GNAT family N-acetyltransferase [Kitasatospora sp. NPDC054939]
MDTRSALDLANDNAAAYWLAQARTHGWEAVHTPRFTAVRCEGDAADSRVLVTRPYGQPDALKAELLDVLHRWRTQQYCLEDPYGQLDMRPHGCEAALGQAVMIRKPGDAPAGAASVPPRREPPTTLTTGEALDPGALAEVEQVVVEGFPVPGHRQQAPGTLLPARLLAAPGHRAWLARIDDRPAGACISFDDGTTVGLYYVTTLPAHRSHGIGRAVVEAALAAHPDRTATLVSTLLGEPLYRRLGFTEHAVTRWWRHSADRPPLSVRPPATTRTAG